MILQLVKCLSEPPVQHLSFPARAAAHTGLWALWLLLLQSVIQLAVFLLSKLYLKQTARAPKLSRGRMLAEDAVGYLGWTWLLGLYAAWLNPGAGGWSWDYSAPNLLAVGYFATALLMVYDAYSYVVHRWMHANKTAFRLLHAKHHEHKASLDVTTSGYMALSEGVLSSAIPMACLYHAGLATGSWWYALAGIHNAFHIVMVGHCGHDYTLNDARDMLMLLVNPFGLWYFNIPCHATPMEHEEHHRTPMHNFAFFFTWWDDKFGSSHPKQEPCTLLVLAVHAGYQAFWMTSVYLWLTQPAAALTAYVLACWVLPPAAAAAQLLRLPEATRWLLGWLMDAYREQSCVTYAAPGTMGAFDPSFAVPAADNKAAATARRDSSSDDTVAVRDTSAPAVARPAAAAARSPPQPVFLFACHPVGLISRGAFTTFAARGWRSPVSGLTKVRLAVGSQLFRTPVAFFREALLACGCITADRDSVSHALRSGCSVAVTPGGWRETHFHGSYSLVLKRRQGFVQLAAETGALLVPVLCVGEEAINSTVPLRQLFRVLKHFRPFPIKMVFGQALAPMQGESVAELHSRYTQALLTLGKQHGVQLTIEA